MPFHHRARGCARRRATRRLFVVLASLLLTGVGYAELASAAPPPPQAAANCFGGLTKAPTADEPNLLSYKFACDTAISAYTLVVNRTRGDFSTVDDFSTTALVTLSNGSVDPNSSFGCEGALPGNGVNCNAGTGGSMPAFENAQGTFDLTDPYCGLSAPTSPSKPSKRSSSQTTAEPPATVQLVVTDATGAQDGPFWMGLKNEKKACKASKKKSGQHKKHGSRK